MMTSRIGAVHLGWNVLAIAAGGGGIDIRPLKVEGAFSPPAYLLADAMGRLHTGSHQDRRGLSLAVEDVRDVVGFREIVVAGATWPAESVFQARLFNPMAEISRYLGAADLVALPYPHDWSDDKVETYCELVSTFGVEVDPLPESVALAAYVRATEFVESGVTAVYCDGRSALVVAVHDDPDRPTESVDIPVRSQATTDPAAADRMVYDVLAAARSVGAETRKVVLTGPICFNDSVRLALRNHLGTRLQVADHPMHAIALGAVDLLHRDEETAEAAEDPGLSDSYTESFSEIFAAPPVPVFEEPHLFAPPDLANPFPSIEELRPEPSDATPRTAPAAESGSPSMELETIALDSPGDAEPQRKSWLARRRDR